MQRNHPQLRLARAARGARPRVLAGVLALAVLAGAPLLHADTPPDGGQPPTGAGGGLGSFFAGDETIGTLPIYGPPTSFDLLRFLLDAQANVFLEGHRLDLFSTILAVEGRTAATVEVVDPATDRWRLTFHGRPTLVLDRAMVEAGAVQFGLNVPTSFGQGELDWSFGARQLDGGSVQPGVLDLPIATFVSADLLGRRGLGYSLTGPEGRRTELRVSTTPDYVVVQQAH